MTSPIVIGIGNIYRGDDGVGLLVARRVKELSSDMVATQEYSGDGLALMDNWQDSDPVILVDAIRSGAEPGRVFRFNAGKRPLPSGATFISTHAISLSEGIEIKRALNQLPNYLIVYGIEGENFQAGAGLTPAVEAAVQVVADQVLDEIGIMLYINQEKPID